MNTDKTNPAVYFRLFEIRRYVFWIQNVPRPIIRYGLIWTIRKLRSSHAKTNISLLENYMINYVSRRVSGWSGGESGRGDDATAGSSSLEMECAEERCDRTALPCARYCLSHVTLAPDQRLYAACAAVFAGGARCRHPLLPLHDQTPLCAEHAWKRVSGFFISISTISSRRLVYLLIQNIKQKF